MTQQLEVPDLAEQADKVAKEVTELLVRINAYVAARVQKGELNLVGQQSAVAPGQPMGLTPEELNLLKQMEKASFDLIGLAGGYKHNFAPKGVILSANV